MKNSCTSRLNIAKTIVLTYTYIMMNTAIVLLMFYLVSKLFKFLGAGFTLLLTIVMTLLFLWIWYLITKRIFLKPAIEKHR